MKTGGHHHEGLLGPNVTADLAAWEALQAKCEKYRATLQKISDYGQWRMMENENIKYRVALELIRAGSRDKDDDIFCEHGEGCSCGRCEAAVVARAALMGP